MGKIIFWVAGAALFLGIGATSIMAQETTLLLSTSGDAATASGSFPDFDDEEILLFSPPAGSEPSEFFNDLAWGVVVGDTNGNDLFDDEPGELDALHIPDGSSPRPTIYDAFVSFSASENFQGGAAAEDGDVVRLLPGGGIELIFDEPFFESATGTSNVDVDGFTMVDGDIFFSFADSEETTFEYLIQENNGSSTLLDGTVMIVRSGETAAHVWFTEDQALQMVQNALGVSNTTIGDTQGLAGDPLNPGELLFVVSSTASQIEGTVFGTAGGGMVASVNGVALQGSAFGFETEEALDALAVIPMTKDPILIHLASPDFPAGDASEIEIPIRHGTPGGQVRLLASLAVLPVLAPMPDPSLQGTGMYFVDTASTLFQNSAVRPKFVFALDENGEGTFRHPPRPIPSGIQLILQVLDLTTMEISDAAVIKVVSPAP